MKWNEGYVVDVDNEKIVVCTAKTRVHESTKRVWYTKEPAILYFYYKKWFNTIAMLRSDGVYYYTNISSPCVYDNGILKYIDYDVDVKTVRSEVYKVLDIGEFYAHRYSMNYSNDISKIVLETLDDVVELFKKRAMPFQDDMAKKYYDKFKSLVY